MIEGAYVTNRQSLERFSCSFDREELRRFLSILQERLDAAAELEVSNFQQLNQPDEEFENNKRKEFLDVNFNKILDKILATTSQAVKRRKIILNILENDGEKDTANIIDELKKIEGYKGLHKKSHLAQIKNDMDALVNLELVEEHGRRYFLVKKINP